MQLHQLDRDPQKEGAMPISAALMILATIINDMTNGVPDNVREAARLALDGARMTLTTTLTVRQKEGGGFVLDFTKVVPAPVPKVNVLLDALTSPLKH